MNKSIEDRLIEFYKKNLSCQEALEESFPDIVHQIPFAHHGQFFMRKQYTKNLYMLVFKNDRFHVKNIKNGVFWNENQYATNHKDVVGRLRSEQLERAYLSKIDLNALLKPSGCSVKQIRFLHLEDFTELHSKLFKDE